MTRWFAKNCRDLPWRRVNGKGFRDPYATWISEIMLQQTKVETVIPYFNKWMKKYPTVASLAKAEERQVLHSWSGLGYYSRAKSLRKAAREITVKGEGFPHTREALLSLPGIGPYTAGAILSLAFKKPEPILDGNITRVFYRYYGVAQYPDTAVGKKWFWQMAGKWAQGPDVEKVNEGLMELGAMLCAPSSPRCGLCPLGNACLARKYQCQENRPRKKKKEQTVPMVGEMIVITRGESVLLQKPKTQSWLASFSTFPFLKKGKKIDKEFPFLAEWEKQTYGGKIRHAITRYRFELSLCTTQIHGVFKCPPDFQWVNWKKDRFFLVPSLNRKIWRFYRKSLSE